MMTQTRPSRRWARTTSAAAVAAAAVLVACDIPSPTPPAGPIPSRAAVEALVNGLTAEDTVPRGGPAAVARNQPVIFVDGVKLADSVAYQLEKLEPSDIRRVEVWKGSLARKFYPDDPQAANGVIHVYMKPQRVGERREGSPR
jgi:hypothetical protein